MRQLCGKVRICLLLDVSFLGHRGDGYTFKLSSTTHGRAGRYGSHPFIEVHWFDIAVNRASHWSPYCVALLGLPGTVYEILQDERATPTCQVHCTTSPFRFISPLLATCCRRDRSGQRAGASLCAISFPTSYQAGLETHLPCLVASLEGYVLPPLG